MRTVGPFHLFRLKLDKDSAQPKGYGFCEYKDQDLAASALRNLNKYDLNRRELKVDLASDNKNGVNLRQEEIRLRDAGEIVNEHLKYMSGNADFSLEEILKGLSSQQETMLLWAIKEVYEKCEREGGSQGK